MAAQSSETARNYLAIAGLLLFMAGVIPAILIFDLRQHQESGLGNYIIASALGVFLIVSSANLLFRGIQNYRIVQKLEKEGVQLKAKITRKWIDTFKSEKFFRVSYRIREDIEIWENVTAEHFKKLKTEKDVLIRALERNPEIARLERL